MYLTLKTLHIVAIISWMAGVLYLYRLFVYHTENVADKSRTAMLEVMERRLYRYITVPAMVVAWIAALCMFILNPLLLKSGWMHTKLLFVVGLTVVTLYGGWIMADLRLGRRQYSTRFLRVMNEVPTLLMILIIILVVFRPF